MENKILLWGKLEIMSNWRADAGNWSTAGKFYAGTHSTDGGGNSGWIFTDPPSPRICYRS